ncbi:MAG: copper resistance protein NlpE, partial [Nitrospira sp.]|nr:copper resistance protein NlpE [Nitrospira sp.]
IVFTAMADGTFMFSEDGTNDPNGVNGMERGTYTWNPATGAFISTVQTDTNREWGLSDDGPVTVTVTGNTLVATVRNGDQFTFTRVVDTNGPVEPIVGAWRFDDTDGPGSLVVLTLFENGSFVLVQDESLPTSDGTERGTYSVAPNGDVTFTRILDTSPTAGLFSAEDPGPVVLNIVVSGDTLTLNDGEEIFRGTRIRAPQ